MGSHLAILESIDDIVWMKGTRIHHPTLRPEKYWIGGYQNDGKWLWKGDIVDSPVHVTDWSATPFNPDNAGLPEGAEGSQDCIAQYDAHNRFTWDDYYCTRKLNFICEKDIS